MIYQTNNVYYLKKANEYEIANLEIKYNGSKKKNVLVVTGSGVYVSNLGELKEYSFKELEKKLCEKE